MDENVKAVLRICKEAHSTDILPLAPYLVAVQYLNDSSPEERELGILTNEEHFKRKIMDETWLCGPRISRGMKGEVHLSLQYGIPLVCHNPALKNELEQIVEQYLQGKNAALHAPNQKPF